MQLPAGALAELDRLEESLKAFALHEVEADVVLDFGLASEASLTTAASYST